MPLPTVIARRYSHIVNYNGVPNDDTLKDLRKRVTLFSTLDLPPDKLFDELALRRWGRGRRRPPHVTAPGDSAPVVGQT